MLKSVTVLCFDLRIFFKHLAYFADRTGKQIEFFQISFNKIYWTIDQFKTNKNFLNFCFIWYEQSENIIFFQLGGAVGWPCSSSRESKHMHSSHSRPDHPNHRWGTELPAIGGFQGTFRGAIFSFTTSYEGAFFNFMLKIIKCAKKSIKWQC